MTTANMSNNKRAIFCPPTPTYTPLVIAPEAELQHKMELGRSRHDVERLTAALRAKDEGVRAKDKEIADLKKIIEGLQKTIEGLQKTFADSDKRHAESVKSLQRTFEDRISSVPRIDPGYVSTVATTVIDVVKGIVGKLADRKRPSAGISPPAKRLRLGDCDIVTSPMIDTEDYDDVFYDAVSSNDNTTPSTAPSTAPDKREHLDTAPVSTSPAPHANDNTTISLGDDDQLGEDDNSNKNGLDDDNETGSSVVATVENFDMLQAYDADGNLKRWDELSTAVQDEVRTFLSTRSQAGLYGSEGWYGKVTRSYGKHCINQARTANHITSHTAVACKTCAHQHLLCVSKVADNTLALRPLCALDRNACNNPSIDSIDFFRLPQDTKAPSKKASAGQYGKVVERS